MAIEKNIGGVGKRKNVLDGKTAKDKSAYEKLLNTQRSKYPASAL